MLTRRVLRITQLLLIPLLIGLVGCENHNLFSKLHGESSNPTTLNAEASIALQNKDYSQAVELTNKVLAQNPHDTTALYYSAAAKMGLAGLNLSVLVSNVLGQVGSSSVSTSSLDSLGDLMRRGRDGGYAQNSCGGATSLIAGLNCETLENVIGGVIDNLIEVSHADDGPVSANAIFFDLGILSALDAALIAASNNYVDVVNTNGTYGVTAGANLNSMCTSHPEHALAIVRNLANSYRDFDTILKLGSSSSVVRSVRDDIQSVGEKLLTPGQVLPQACFDDVFTPHSPSITKDNFTTVAI
jgi:hypothetical protein